MSFTYDEIKSQAYQACKELVEIAKLQKGDIFVVGCSSSEVMGQHIGKASDINAAGAVYEGIMPLINKYNLGVIKGKHQLPIYIPADDPFIETLMDVYREHTGDTESKPLVIGGGTYARASSGIVAFGARFPHEEELAHQKDEYIEIESLVKTAKIYADAIYRLTKPE